MRSSSNSRFVMPRSVSLDTIVDCVQECLHGLPEDLKRAVVRNSTAGSNSAESAKQLRSILSESLESLLRSEAERLETTVSGQPAIDDASGEIDARHSLEAAQRLAKAGSWVHDIDSGAISWSSPMHSILGVTAENAPAGYGEFLALVPLEERDRLETAFAEAQERQVSFEADHRIVRPDGSIRHLHSRCEPLPGGRRLLGAVVDVTDRVAREQKIEEAERRFRSLAESIPAMVWEADLSGHFIYLSSACTQFLGNAAEKNPNEAWLQAVHPEDLPRLGTAFQHAFADNDSFGSYIRIRQDSDGEYRWFHVMGAPVRNEADEIERWVGVCLDVHEAKSGESRLKENLIVFEEYSQVLQVQAQALMQANVRLEALATTDGLTRLLNHRTFHDRLIHMSHLAADTGLTFSLALLDIDGFKGFNDEYGHLEGDSVLRQIGEILQRIARDGDVVARYGGEEFALILKGADAGDSAIAADRVRHAISSHPWRFRTVMVSVGVATWHDNATDPLGLIAAADRALYASKGAGGNCVTHAMEMAQPSG